MCVALIMSPTAAAAVAGLVVGGLLGAALYNNSLKRQIQERPRGAPPGQ
jgi:high-affinity Fe2+/Pb2+ permease